MEIVDNLTQNIKTVIGANSSFVGSIENIDNLTIEGQVVCTNDFLKLKETLVIAKEGRLKCAKINVEAVYINGVFLGDIYANQRVILQEKSLVYGNIYTPEIISYKGAQFYGELSLFNHKDNRQDKSIHRDELQKSIKKYFQT